MHPLLSGAIVVLPEERLATRGAVDPQKLGRLIVAMHARQAHVLLRRVRKWDDLQPLSGIAIDLVSAIEDERDSGAAVGGTGKLRAVLTSGSCSWSLQRPAPRMAQGWEAQL
jgi:hypothetical protein